MMMALGTFVFKMDTAPYQRFTQSISWNHPATNRVGLRPARQFVGPGDDVITLSGVLLPEITGGEPSIQQLKEMADRGESWVLVEGTGKVYGFFIIDKLDITRDLFFTDGAARRIEFNLSLARSDDINKLGTLT